MKFLSFNLVQLDGRMAEESLSNHLPSQLLLDYKKNSNNVHVLNMNMFPNPAQI